MKEYICRCIYEEFFFVYVTFSTVLKMTVQDKKKLHTSSPLDAYCIIRSVKIIRLCYFDLKLKKTKELNCVLMFRTSLSSYLYNITLFLFFSFLLVSRNLVRIIIKRIITILFLMTKNNKAYEVEIHHKKRMKV